MEIVLANVRQLHHVPGRKTDLIGCQRRQLLDARGPLRGSFRPGESITRLRALHRQMANLVPERPRWVKWIEQVFAR